MSGKHDGAVIVVADLEKSMGGVEAVRGVSFTVEQGSVFGLIGPNGAGKTTTLRCLLGLLVPDAGYSSILGVDSRRLPREVRQRIGYLSEEPFPYSDAAIPGILSFLCALYARWDWKRCEDLVKRLDVRTDCTLDEMSVGQRRRAELLIALAPGPEVLVLDDPWLGVDARSRRQFLMATLEMAREEGTTILFTSHVLSDVERVADRVAIIVEGRIRAADELDALKARTRRLVVELEDTGEAARVVVPGEVERILDDGVLSVVTTAYAPGMETRLSPGGGDARCESMNLEEIFLALTGEVTES